MPENRGNAVAYAGGTTGRPLPRPDERAYRAAHQERPSKPTSTFDWDWNKGTCTDCQNKVPKPTLVDGLCPTCRGESATSTSPATSRPRREHSKSGEQVYVPYDEQELDTRFHAPAQPPSADVPTDTRTDIPEPAIDEPAPTQPDALPAEPPSSPVEHRQPPRPQPDVLAHQLDHTSSTLTRAHGHTDPIVGMLRTAALSAIAALDVYLELHAHTTTEPPSPASLGLDGDQPAADPEGEAGRQPARSQTPKKPRSRPAPRGDIDEAAVVREYTVDLDSTPTIASRHGVRPKRIREILTRRGVELRDDRATRSGSKPKHRDPATIDLIVRRYRDDLATIADLSEATGIGRRQISSLLRTAGVTLRPPANMVRRELTDQERESVVTQYATGVSLAIVGKAHGIRAESVRDIVRAAGVPLHTRGGAHSDIPKRLDRLGVTSKQVKAWAVKQGLVPAIARGNIPRELVDAWEAAHPTNTQETS